MNEDERLKLIENSEDKTDLDAQSNSQAQESSAEESAPESQTESDAYGELEKAKAQAAEYLESLQRLKAEFDNFRKRNEKERQRLSEVHQAVVVEAILPTLDAFELAFRNIPDEQSDDYMAGMKLLYQGLKDSLTKLGLQRMSLAADAYDPEFAEAIASIPHDEIPVDHIIEEVRAGYRFKNAVLRPAKVIISSGKPPLNGGSEE
jgi:molecular chaperone GrpE